VFIYSPYVIHYYEHGYFTKERLGLNDTCPDTHYRCPGHLTTSMPVYTRCNGWFDCEGRQDEDDCDSYQCPGFYRCLDSKICVHPDHVCDGWAQCPQRDDEWLCEENPCPDGCVCVTAWRLFVFILSPLICTHSFVTCTVLGQASLLPVYRTTFI
jgi:hypothetical protein